MGTLRLCVVLNRSVFIPSTRKRSDTDLTEGCLCLRLSRYWPWPAQPLLKSTAFMSQPRMKPGSSSLTQPAVPRHFPCSEQPYLSLSLPTWSLPAPAQRAPTTTEMITNTTPMPNKITDMPASIGPTTTDSSMDSTLSHGSPCSRMSTRSSLQRLGLPEEAHLRGHEGARILRSCCPEVQDWIPVRQVPRDLGPSRRHEGAPR